MIVPREGINVTIRTFQGNVRVFYHYNLTDDDDKIPNRTVHDGEIPTDGTTVYIATNRKHCITDTPVYHVHCRFWSSPLTMRVIGYIGIEAKIEIAIFNVCCTQPQDNEWCS